MISKESLILIAVLIVLVIGFMNWSQDKAIDIQDAVDEQLENILIM